MESIESKGEHNDLDKRRIEAAKEDQDNYQLREVYHQMRTNMKY